MKKLDKDILKLKNTLENSNITPPDYLKKIVITYAIQQQRKKYRLKYKIAAIVILLIGVAISIHQINKNNNVKKPHNSYTQKEKELIIIKPESKITNSKKNKKIISYSHPRNMEKNIIRKFTLNTQEQIITPKINKLETKKLNISVRHIRNKGAIIYVSLPKPPQKNKKLFAINLLPEIIKTKKENNKKIYDIYLKLIKIRYEDQLASN